MQNKYSVVMTLQLDCDVAAGFAKKSCQNLDKFIIGPGAVGLWQNSHYYF